MLSSVGYAVTMSHFVREWSPEATDQLSPSKSADTQLYHHDPAASCQVFPDVFVTHMEEEARSLLQS